MNPLWNILGTGELLDLTHMSVFSWCLSWCPFFFQSSNVWIGICRSPGQRRRVESKSGCSKNVASGSQSRWRTSCCNSVGNRLYSIHTKAILNTGMENRTVRNMIWGSRILPLFQVVSTICFLPNSWTFLKCKVSNHNLG